MSGENLLRNTLKGGLLDLQTDELVVDALRDIIRDEVKSRMREALDKNPALKQELRDAVRSYFEAKVHQTYAELKIAKASAKLGLETMPPHLRDELTQEFARILEREVTALLEKAI